MHNLGHIALGSANFCAPYGIMNQGTALEPQAVDAIFKKAILNGIRTIDTAFAYGDLFSLLKGKPYVPDLEIITKFSVLDNYDDLLYDLSNLQASNRLPNFYGLLVHDPRNLSEADPLRLRAFLDTIRESGLVRKIGISVYDIAEVEKFHNIIVPDLIQIPLNPLNQTFNCTAFKKYVAEHKIEIHARSLFLQGILLAKTLPTPLKDLEPLWQKFNNIAGAYSSRLQVVLSWAMNQGWIDKWVLGVSSVDDLEAIIQQISSSNNQVATNLFDYLKQSVHPLVDPRNWSTK